LKKKEVTFTYVKRGNGFSPIIAESSGISAF